MALTLLDHSGLYAEKVRKNGAHKDILAVVKNAPFVLRVACAAGGLRGLQAALVYDTAPTYKPVAFVRAPPLEMSALTLEDAAGTRASVELRGKILSTQHEGMHFCVELRLPGAAPGGGGDLTLLSPPIKVVSKPEQLEHNRKRRQAERQMAAVAADALGAVVAPNTVVVGTDANGEPLPLKKGKVLNDVMADTIIRIEEQQVAQQRMMQHLAAQLAAVSGAGLLSSVPESPEHLGAAGAANSAVFDYGAAATAAVQAALMSAAAAAASSSPLPPSSSPVSAMADDEGSDAVAEFESNFLGVLATFRQLPAGSADRVQRVRELVSHTTAVNPLATGDLLSLIPTTLSPLSSPAHHHAFDSDASSVADLSLPLSPAAAAAAAATSSDADLVAAAAAVLDDDIPVDYAMLLLPPLPSLSASTTTAAATSQRALFAESATDDDFCRSIFDHQPPVATAVFSS